MEFHLSEIEIIKAIVLIFFIDSFTIHSLNKYFFSFCLGLDTALAMDLQSWIRSLYSSGRRQKKKQADN